ncbi:hypothetical protein [Promicromonospora sp. NPDC023987]|uniref:hypothetical protein n=1 Tax=Promicromonospora sp. NPDC023987 TaxID=3155360 RepID=UPI0033DF897F
MGKKRVLPFFSIRTSYEVVIKDGDRIVYSGFTTTPSAILVSKGKVHTTDSYDWIAAAEHAFAPTGDTWVTDPFGGR